MVSVAFFSATAGALLAVSFASQPLMRSPLNPKEASTFNSDRISGTGLQFSQLTRPVNILVLAMSVLPEDVRNPPPGTTNLSYSPQVNSFDGLSDTMLLMRFDPQTGKTVVLSIPRDTRVPIEGHGVQKINAANELGGVALSAKTVSTLLDGVQIDRYIRINVLGFAKLIDALGGIDFYVPKDMKYKDDTQHLYIDLKAGEQHLNGDQALQMLRFRYDALGDIGRIQRQQLMMRALMEKFLNPAIIAKFPQIFSVVHDYIDTNLTIEEMVSVLSFAAQTSRSNTEMLLVKGRFSEPKEFNTSYWLPNQKGIDSLMAEHFDLTSQTSFPQAIDPASVNIAIQDSTGEPKAVRALVRSLEAAGYSRIQIAKPWHQPLGVTHIIAQQGDDRSATTIRQLLGLGEVRVESTGILYTDVTIRLGQDWLTRQKAVNSVEQTQP
ncbi:MAG: LCP family protein [Chroococcidiopsidaceae cyanobacterium CP_BM_ER_R8_30]|nr:LCP family protein [Chroococcidiopsidaceae cyanobacterium CP_BM_ER_R8_30]